MNAKQRIIFLTIVWVVSLVLTIAIPKDYRLMWVILGLIMFLFLFLLNLIELKGYRLDPYTGISKVKQKEWIRPYNMDTDNQFNYQLIIDLAALISNNDPMVMKEVTAAAFDFENYSAEFLSYHLPGETTLSEEHYRTRWYPNSDVDLNIIYDNTDDRPAFCCLNMINWLIDRNYVIFMYVKTDYTEFISIFRKELSRRNIPINLDMIPFKKDDTDTRVIYPLDNLHLLGKALHPINYYLIGLNVMGDYSLAIISEEEYGKIMQMDLTSVDKELKIDVYGG